MFGLVGILPFWRIALPVAVDTMHFHIVQPVLFLWTTLDAGKFNDHYFFCMLLSLDLTYFTQVI